MRQGEGNRPSCRPRGLRARWAVVAGRATAPFGPAQTCFAAASLFLLFSVSFIFLFLSFLFLFIFLFLYCFILYLYRFLFIIIYKVHCMLHKCSSVY